MTQTQQIPVKLHYAKINGFYVWERESGNRKPFPMDGDSILIAGAAYRIGSDIGDGHGAQLEHLGTPEEYECDWDLEELEGLCSAR